MENDETTYAHLVPYYLPDLNSGLSLTQHSPGSGKPITWSCQLHGQWTTPFRVTYNAKQPCPYCAGRLAAVGITDLATTHPEVAAEWSQSNPLTAQQVTASSTKPAYWECTVCSHAWKQSPYKRTHAEAGRGKPRGCPACAGRASKAGFNDLASQHPEFATEWHPTKNFPLQPADVTGGTNQKVWWSGSCGHEWLMSVKKRVQGQGCPYCSGNAVLPGFNDASSRAPVSVAKSFSKSNTFTLEEVTYGSEQTALWMCDTNNHPDWNSTVNNRLSKRSGCPRCAAGRTQSRGESILYQQLLEVGIDSESILRNERKALPRHELDLYLPTHNFAIEFNGIYWHNETHKGKNYHHEKWEAATDAGIQLIQIWEDELRRNPERVKKMIAHKLGVQLPGERRVMARKMHMVQVMKAQAEAFLDEHHVQGYAAGSYYLGLAESGDIDSLVAVLVLKKEAVTGGKTLNIIRYATSATVAGGFTKLLKHAERVYEPEKFITFSDHCVSDGGLYRNNGFVADKELKPDYMYVVRNERKHKFGYRLKRFRDDPELQYEDGLTERELAQLNGLPRIWDAGKTRWVKQIQR